MTNKTDKLGQFEDNAGVFLHNGDLAFMFYHR